MNKCLYCYEAVEENTDFHKACAKKIFGSEIIPVLDFNLAAIEELAKKIIIKSIAVTGVQAKLSLQLEKTTANTKRFTIVDLEGNYILKPNTLEYEELPENEDLSMHLAELVNIKTAKHTLIRLASGELAYLTKRFDREKKKKIHVEDFCQLTENITVHKYNSSVENIGKTLYKFTINKGLEAQKLFEVVLFSYLIGNTDMHLKNFSLMENKNGEFELSPAYDLVNTKLVIPDDDEEFALHINGKKNKLRLSDFEALARNLKIPEKTMANIFNRFIKVLPSWIAFINKSFLSAEMQEKYIEILKHKHKHLFSSIIKG